jgi:DNA-binding LacI/PurR family transcriptional regulator
VAVTTLDNDDTDSPSSKPATPTHRRVTAADVARAVGLSRATVGFVLNDTPGQTIPAHTRERVLAAARNLGYRPHLAARALASGQSRIVLLVLPDWPVDFTMRRNIEEATLALDEAGYSLVTSNPLHAGRARPLWETLQPDVVMSLAPFSPQRLAQLRAAGVRKIVPDPEHVAIEEYTEQGPALQVAHLVENGHRTLAFVATADPRLAMLARERHARALSAATEAGVALVDAGSVSLAEAESAARAIETARERGATAIVAYNDDVAIALVGAALRAGLRVPEDLAVIGHDDIPLAAVIEPRITSVRLDIAGLGRYLAGIALGLAEDAPLPDALPARNLQVVVRDSA